MYPQLKFQDGFIPLIYKGIKTFTMRNSPKPLGIYKVADTLYIEIFEVKKMPRIKGMNHVGVFYEQFGFDSREAAMEWYNSYLNLDFCYQHEFEVVSVEDEAEKFYGVDDGGVLYCEPEEAADAYFENIEKDFCELPITVYEYARKSIAADVVEFGKDILSGILDELDEKFGDPDGDYTSPTEKMISAAVEFVKVIEVEYKPWACQKTGETLFYYPIKRINNEQK